MQEVIKVEGMSCNNCVQAIEKNVVALPGVSTVQVNLEAGEVTVDFEEATVSLNDIKEAIEDQGFDALS